MASADLYVKFIGQLHIEHLRQSHRHQD